MEESSGEAMSWEVIRVTEDIKRPAGHAILTLSIAGVNELPSSLEFGIHRRGHNENSLGDSGWQGADYWFTPEEAWVTQNNELLQFVFRSEAMYELQHMPYELLLRGKGMEEPISVSLYWPDTLDSEEPNEGQHRPIGEGTHIQEPSPEPPQPDAPPVPPQPDIPPAPEPEEQPVPIEEMEKEVETPVSEKVVEPKVDVQKPATREGSDVLKLLFLIGILVVVVLFAAMAGYFLLKGEPEPAQETSVSQDVQEIPTPSTESADDQTGQGEAEPEEPPATPDPSQNEQHGSTQEPQPAEESPPPDTSPESETVQEPARDATMPEQDPDDVDQVPETPSPATDPEPQPPIPEPEPEREDQSLQENLPLSPPPEPEGDLGKDLEDALKEELKKDSTIQEEFDSLINRE